MPRVVLEAILWAPENGLALCSVCHARHTSAHARVPREALPDAALRFAEGLGEWAVARLDREYPAGGPGRALDL